MPIIRNPFRRQDENLRPINTAIDTRQAGSKSRESIDVKEKAPVEYQLSGKSLNHQHLSQQYKKDFPNTAPLQKSTTAASSSPPHQPKPPQQQPPPPAPISGQPPPPAAQQAVTNPNPAPPSPTTNPSTSPARASIPTAEVSTSRPDHPLSNPRNSNRVHRSIRGRFLRLLVME